MTQIYIYRVIAFISGERNAFGQLRMLRILRPLRTLQKLPGMNIVATRHRILSSRYTYV
jgi:hypothetical protein